jgi:polar amino acid transport system substrate-binding protein
MRFSRLLAVSAGLWLAAFVVHPFRDATAAAGIQKPTTNDGVYTKAQADKAKAQFDKICADCHPFTVAGKKKPKDRPLGEEPFFEEWEGRPLSELIGIIHLTMPNDGSANLTEAEATDLTAYILQQNGYPEGKKPLAKATASAIIERPKK